MAYVHRTSVPHAPKGDDRVTEPIAPSPPLQTTAYGFCLTIYESSRHEMVVRASQGDAADLVVPVAAAYAPKCLCLLSHWPYFRAFRQFLMQLHTYSQVAEAVTRLPVEWCVHAQSVRPKVRFSGCQH